MRTTRNQNYDDTLGASKGPVWATSSTPPVTPTPSSGTNLPGMTPESLATIEASKTEAAAAPPPFSGSATFTTPKVTPPVTPDNAYVAPDKPPASVAENLTGLLSESNPYMKSAETKGMQYANQRGLLNSSLGVEAVEKARIDAALPIAQQDAAYAQDIAKYIQTSGIDFDQKKYLLNSQLGVQIAESDMPSELKDQMFDWLDGVSPTTGGGTTTTGTTNAPNFTANTPSVFEDYQATQDEFDGNFAKYVTDSKAIENFKTGESYPTVGKAGSENAQASDYREWIDPLADKILTGNYPKDNFGRTLYSSAARDKLNKFIDRFGTWDNAMVAVETWLGPNAAEQDKIAAIQSTL